MTLDLETRNNGSSHKKLLVGMFGLMCCTHNGDGCGQTFKERSALTIDHIVPKALGGSDNIVNKQLLCYKCHRRKHQPSKMVPIRKNPGKLLGTFIKGIVPPRPVVRYE